MISDELQEKVREAWYQAIPEQYRNTGKERKADYSTGDHPAHTARRLAGALAFNDRTALDKGSASGASEPREMR